MFDKSKPVILERNMCKDINIFRKSRKKHEITNISIICNQDSPKGKLKKAHLYYSQFIG